MASIAPLRESDESRRCRWFRYGRRQWFIAGISVGLIALVCVALWQMWSEDELPDIGDPFDVPVALRPVDLPDDQNAYAVYATAHAGRVMLPAAWTFAWSDFKAMTWSSAGQDVRVFVDQKRTALEKWRVGSERPDALYLQPEQVAKDQPIPLTQDMLFLATLAGLEGSRLEEAGAMDQAWEWYRALLRFSRLVGRHGGARWVGAIAHEHATSRIVHWAADPRVDVAQLRKALDDTLVADALTPPLSEWFKFGYLWRVQPDFVQFLRESNSPVPPLPGGEFGPLDQMASLARVTVPARLAWLRKSNGLERSRRAVRLLYANWLPQVDRPATKRAPVAMRQPLWIYAADPTAPPAASAVAPDLLARVIEGDEIAKTLLFRFLDPSRDPMLSPWESNGELARERRRRSALIVRLAAEWYRREHGQLPPTAGVLLGGFLKELPEGIAANDPVPAGLE
jgi:hypothetical protein